MAHVYITRHIPSIGINLLRSAGHTVTVSEKDGVLSKRELMSALSQYPYDAVLCLLTDAIDGEIMDTVPTAKIFANYAVGFNNIDLAAAKARGITITNTPGVLDNSVAEFTVALILATVRRLPESERFLREGKYDGWAPELLLGMDLKGKTLGILGAGRIGQAVAHKMHFGFGMHILYQDMKRLPEFEKATDAVFVDSVDDLLPRVDIVSVHVPLLPSTEHLINAARLALMKQGAYLINTSRGPVVDEAALVEVLKKGSIRGAGLDVFEHEPALTPGLKELHNAVITPHVASATDEARDGMSEKAAQNIIDFLAGEIPENTVPLPA